MVSGHFMVCTVTLFRRRGPLGWPSLTSTTSVLEVHQERTFDGLLGSATVLSAQFQDVPKSQFSVSFFLKQFFSAQINQDHVQVEPFDRLFTLTASQEVTGSERCIS